MNFTIPIRLIPHNLSFDFVGKRNIAFCFSIIVTIAAIAGFFTKGLNLSIDFAGGFAIEVSQIELEDARDVMSKLEYKGVTVQQQSAINGESLILIRMQPKNANSYQKEIEEIKNAIKTAINTKKTLNNINDYEDDLLFQRIDYVGPKVGKDFVQNALQAMIIALLVMMAYTWFRFEWQFGIGVMLALLHDAIATLGFYVISGYEFDLTSIAAILTIIGYSINDSVVIYDRIRENSKKMKGKKMHDIINLSINETLSRTLMTVATTLLVCAILAGFGGNSLRGFSVATFFGIAFGTYSSIYLSAPILILLQKIKK